MIVYVATTNPGKLRELGELTAGSELRLITDELYEEADEGEASYAENAAIKARRYREILLAHNVRAAVMADDSGLEIAALNGRPGVLSARYGGNVDWPTRRALLLEELREARDRSARFVCAIHFIDERGHEIAVEGVVAGDIVEEERGTEGFSYDPLFFYPPLGRTFGELGIREKNAISHRARAVGALLHALDEHDEREKH